MHILNCTVLCDLGSWTTKGYTDQKPNGEIEIETTEYKALTVHGAASYSSLSVLGIPPYQRHTVAAY